MNDAALLADLDATIFAAAAYSLASWQDEFKNNSTVVLLAETNERAIAFVSATQAGDEIEIRKIGVLPEFRRQGIAAELIRHILEIFSGTQPLRCLIDVSATNDSAVAFYRKLGFEDLMRRKRYYADGSDAIVMELIK